MADFINPTIFLIKKKATNPEDIFIDKNLEKVVGRNRVLFYKKSISNIPQWFPFVGSVFSVPEKYFKNSSSFAAIVFKVSERQFVVPFGMMSHLLDMNKIEPNFGLRVAINVLPNNELRQMDLTTPESGSQKTKKQAYRKSTPEDFGINKQKDILRGVVGRLDKNHVLGERIDGKDSFRSCIKITTFEELKAFCLEALKYSRKRKYKETYPWIDNMAIVDDLETRESLDGKLVEAIKNEQLDNMLLAPPEFIENSSEYEGFLFSGNRKRLSAKVPIPFPDIEEFIKDYGESKLEDLSVEALVKSCKMLLRDDQGNSLKAWSIYKCLVWETGLNGDRKFVLSEGTWYEINKSFYKETERFFSDRVVDVEVAGLPEADIGETEAEYNDKAAKSSEDYYLFDLGVASSRTKSIGRDKNELCDIFDVKEKWFVHIKRGKTSDKLSHLFRQGVFSGAALKRDKEIRSEVNKHLRGFGCQEAEIKDDFNPAKYTVLFGAIVPGHLKQDIPFFSKVSFRDSTELSLELIGYKCYFTFIKSR